MHNQDIETRIQSLESRLNRYRSVSIGLALALVVSPALRPTRRAAPSPRKYALTKS